MKPTSERPSVGPTPETAHQAVDSVSEGYALVEQSVQGLFRMVTDPNERVELLENVWTSAEYAALSKTEQDALRARYGTGTVVETTTPVAEQPQETAPQAAEPSAAKTPERRETGKPPLKRVFKQYRTSYDDINKKLIVVEDVDVYDDAKSAYEPKLGIPTKIQIPEKLQGRILSEPEIEKAVIEAATEVRTKLDENGLKLFLDKARWDIPATQAQNERTAVANKDGSVERLYLKWKYKIDDGQQARDFLELSEVPENILKLLKEDKDYWKRPEWKKWFGVQMQKKREEIITQKIASAVGEGKDDVEGPDMDVQTSTEIEEAEDVVETPKPEVAKPVETPVEPPKVEAAPTPAPAPKPVAKQPIPVAAPKVEAAPVAPAVAAPEVVATPEVPKEVTTEQLREDVLKDVQKSIAAYRKMYAKDVAGLANRVISASFVLLTQEYALAHAAMDAERLFTEVKKVTEEQLGMNNPPAPKPEAPKTTETGTWTEDETKEPAPKAETPKVEAAPTPETKETEEYPEDGQLVKVLHGLAERALEGTDATPTEIAFIADKVSEFLLQGKGIAHLAYEPGKRLLVLHRTNFFERVRKLHQALRTQQH